MDHDTYEILTYELFYEHCRWVDYTPLAGRVRARCKGCGREAEGERGSSAFGTERLAKHRLWDAGPCPERRVSRATETLLRILCDLTTFDRLKLATVVRLGITASVPDAVRWAWRACDDGSAMLEWLDHSTDVSSCEWLYPSPNTVMIEYEHGTFRGSPSGAADLVRLMVPEAPLGLLTPSPMERP